MRDKQVREAALLAWARSALDAEGFVVGADFSISPASDDASFRRYFRGEAADQSFIFVDAPPDKEDSAPFVNISKMLRAAGVNAPIVYQHDLNQGYMMLTDLGDRLYLGSVNHPVNADNQAGIKRLYDDALATIIRMQRIPVDDSLPRYDEHRLRIEMNLFTEWFLPRQLSVRISAVEERMIERVFRAMIDSALAQPVGFVHRDYHSRNLMVTDNGNPGVIDFQDAVFGPITYDLVSLMKDCYHKFPTKEVEARVGGFYRLLADEGALNDVGLDTFRRWFDLMGMQRHLKVAGIFSRLNLRDGKPRYLTDIPLVVQYIVEVCDNYAEFEAEFGRFGHWLRERIVPLLDSLDGTA